MRPIWLDAPIKPLDRAMEQAALARQGQLTKPPGALGRLEAIAVKLAAQQGVERPVIDKVAIAVFAGDHGIAAENVSAFPQVVTGEMVKNFARGGAAISVLAKQLGATLEVVNLGTVNDPGEMQGVVRAVIAPQTANFAQGPAMNESQLAQAMQAGRDSALRAQQQGTQLYIAGEMGIANTTAATALGCALLNVEPQELAGPGTGLDAQGIAHKVAVLERALELHRPNCTTPLEALRRVGGFEIAAIAGAYLSCAQLGIPILVDGFIATAAALVAVRMQPACADWMLFGHGSAEPGHKSLIAALEAQPLLDLGMRLGEGSGAATAVPVLQLACALHNGMATFAEAAVSEKL